ncbi:phage major capsid protein [Rhodococcus qingshengii]
MPPTSVLSYNDGPRSTVSDLIGAPMTIPARVLDLLKNRFLSETLLRNAGPNTTGVVKFSESTPLYLGADVEEIAEFAEIPVAAGQVGTPQIALSTQKGLGVRISKQMKNRNDVDAVNTQIKQLTNSMVLADERALRHLLLNPNIPTIAASGAWNTSAGKPRHDIANAMEVVGSASRTGDPDDDETFGFLADTTVLPASLAPVLQDNEDFLKVYTDSLAPESIAYTGRLPKDILSLAGLTSRSWPRNRVLVLERGTVGFFSDEEELNSTGVYPEGNGPNGGPTQSWRSDTTRTRAMGLDQPLAACWITGVVA